MTERDGNPDSKVHGTNMGPLWDPKDPGGPHVGPMNFAILNLNKIKCWSYCDGDGIW